MRSGEWPRVSGVQARRRHPAAGNKPLTRGNGLVAAAAAAVVAVFGLTGCAKMDAALSQQWMTVAFGSGTSAATALQVRAACSHIQNAPPLPLPAKRTAATVVYDIKFNTTNASPANVAELQTCLQKFPSVQGVTPQDTGDEGS
jgi:hypothetical protein